VSLVRLDKCLARLEFVEHLCALELLAKLAALVGGETFVDLVAAEVLEEHEEFVARGAGVVGHVQDLVAVSDWFRQARHRGEWCVGVRSPRRAEAGLDGVGRDRRHWHRHWPLLRLLLLRLLRLLLLLLLISGAARACNALAQQHRCRIGRRGWRMRLGKNRRARGVGLHPAVVEVVRMPAAMMVVVLVLVLVLVLALVVLMIMAVMGVVTTVVPKLAGGTSITTTVPAGPRGVDAIAPLRCDRGGNNLVRAVPHDRHHR
jgi:hypothetical protein